MAMVDSHYASPGGGLKRSQSGNFSASHHAPFSSSPSKQSHFAHPRSFDLPSPRNSPNNSPENSPTVEHAESVTSIAESYESTPASSISLDHNGCTSSDDEDQIVFPSYDDVGYYGQTEDLEPPMSPKGNGDSYTVSPTSNTTSTDASRPDSPEIAEHAEDDTAIRSQPSRHVDYLSHNWREEDIWCSWQLIVSKRGCYSNSARLENASWRTWMKAKYKLKTVSPETLNWYVYLHSYLPRLFCCLLIRECLLILTSRLKDCDVTWLYGPLQTGSGKPFNLPNSSPLPSSRLSKSNSFLHPSKKPILKKRSMSEIMLQRSLSASSLLKQAAAAVQAQQSADRDDDLRPCMGRATSDYIAFPFVSRRMSRENSSVLQSISSSGLASPNYERKHIHFNEQVEQCIALDMSGGADAEAEDAYAYAIDDDDSDSDDGAIMMKRSNSKKLLPTPGGGLTSKKSTRNNSFVNGESKTIAMLPSTTLKYREDTPEPKETAMKHTAGWLSGVSPSSSQETLRPSKTSALGGRGFLLGDDSDDDCDLDWEPPSAFANRKDSISVAQDRMNGLQISSEAGPSGMRRTPSGMFMPADSDEEDAAVNEGLFGKVVDTVNTAKDIAHVIWNVGWRR